MVKDSINLHFTLKNLLNSKQVINSLLVHIKVTMVVKIITTISMEEDKFCNCLITSIIAITTSFKFKLAYSFT
jgi:hypothetical protein